MLVFVKGEHLSYLLVDKSCAHTFFTNGACPSFGAVAMHIGDISTSPIVLTCIIFAFFEICNKYKAKLNVGSFGYLANEILFKWPKWP